VDVWLPAVVVVAVTDLDVVVVLKVPKDVVVVDGKMVTVEETALDSEPLTRNASTKM
jgi:hypothetical protein